MSEIAFILLLLLALAALAAQHNWWARQIADRDADWHTEARRLRNEAASHRDVADSWAAAAESYKTQWMRMANRLAQVNSDLVVERAYSAACDSQLRAIRDQVAGKCLWPTLAPDDVVVELPKRGA